MKIAVVGDVILDETMTVRVRGVSPENDGVVVASSTGRECSLGGAGNVARNCQTLGVDVALLGIHNDPRLGSRLADLTYVTDFGSVGRTPVKTRVVTEGGHYLIRLDDETGTPYGMPDAFWQAGGGNFTAWLDTVLKADTPPVVCLVDYDKGFLSPAAVKCLMTRLRAVNISVPFPIIVDPGRTGNWHRYESMRTIFRANLQQAQQHYVHNVGRHLYLKPVVPPARGDDVEGWKTTALAVAYNLDRAGTQFSHLVLTLGEHGMVLCDRLGERCLAFPQKPVRGADPCGAGDTVTAAMAVCLAGADPLGDRGFEAVQYAVGEANRAARVAVGQPGVYAVTEGDMGWCKTKFK